MDMKIRVNQEFEWDDVLSPDSLYNTGVINFDEYMCEFRYRPRSGMLAAICENEYILYKFMYYLVDNHTHFITEYAKSEVGYRIERMRRYDTNINGIDFHTILEPIIGSNVSIKELLHILGYWLFKEDFHYSRRHNRILSRGY